MTSKKKKFYKNFTERLQIIQRLVVFEFGIFIENIELKSK